MRIDRLQEYVNMLQQKRMQSFVGFDHALHTTELLLPMLHVNHAYQQALRNHPLNELPFTNRMIYQTRAVQDLCLQRAGNDLTVRDDLNHVWYSGNHVSLDGGDYRFRKPSVFYSRVSVGDQ